MSTSDPFARARTALRAAQSLLAFLASDDAKKSPLQQKALLESALLQAHLSLLYYCRSLEIGLSDLNYQPIKQWMQTLDSGSSPQLNELLGLLSHSKLSHQTSATWLDYLLNQYQGLLDGDSKVVSHPQEKSASPQLIAVASEPHFDNPSLNDDTLRQALQEWANFLQRQQEHLQEW